ncbi:hypothetical protein AYO38_07725 [bacterium SCGC AG-212-C10]|nr:hypothetical protein AYO38_07725 [bacterium SCGC AG-212-C10]
MPREDQENADSAEEPALLAPRRPDRLATVRGAARARFLPLSLVFALATVFAAILSSPASGFAQGAVITPNVTCWTLTATLEPIGASTGSLSPLGNCSGDPNRYIDGTVVTLTVIPNNGWIFGGWTGDPVTGGATGQITMNSDKTIVANMAQSLNGAPISGLQVPQNRWRYFFVDVPVNASKLVVTMTGTEDVDVYTRFNALPVLGSWDCRPYSGSSNETCTHDSPAQGRWWVGVNGFGSIAGTVSLTAAVTACWPLSITKFPASAVVQVTPTDCPGGYTDQKQITLTPVNGSGLEFLEWSGDVQSEANPLARTMTAPLRLVANFARRLNSGVPQANQDAPPGVTRYYFINLPSDSARIAAQLNVTAGSAAMSLHAGAHDSPSVCTSPSGSGVRPACILENPGPGLWWVLVTGDTPSTVTVSATVTACVPLATHVVPAGSGTVTPSIEPNCGSGKYMPGTSLSLTATPSGTNAFAIWDQDGNPSQANPLPVTLNAATSVTAYFGSRLDSGQGSNATHGPVFFYTDVTAGVQSLAFKYRGTGLFTVWFKRESTDVSPGPCMGNDGFDCTIFSPQAGRWWVRVDGSSFVIEEIGVTLTQTCFALEASAVGPRGFEQPIGGAVQVVPQPSCGAGLYDSGTQVLLTAADAPGYAFVGWTGDVTSNENPTTLTMDGNRSVVAHYGAEVFPGEPVEPFLFTTDVMHYFYVELPPGLTSVNVTTSGTGDVNLRTRSGTPPSANEADCTSAASGTSAETCSHTQPAAGRLWIGLSGPTAGTITVQVTFTIPVGCFEVTTSVAPANSGTVVANPLPDCTGKYTSGKQITYTPTPKPGFAFAAWEGDLTSTANPLSHTVTQDASLKAKFGQSVQPGATVPGIAVAADDWRYYFADLPAGLPALNVWTIGTGDVDLRLRPDIAPTLSDASCTSATAGSSTESCQRTNPAAGRWWIGLRGPQAGVVTLRVTTGACFQLYVDVSPVSAGTFVATPAPNCGANYTPGTVVHLAAAANAGFAFAAWTQVFVTPTDNALELNLTMNSDQFVRAYFGKQLQSGVPVPSVSPSSQHPRYFYIDVPAGMKALTATATGTQLQFLTRRDKAVIQTAFDCLAARVALQTCIHGNPQAGRWWAYVSPTVNTEITSTVTMTYSTEPVCWSLIVGESPGNATEGPTTVTPAPNCAGGKYEHGTVVTLTAHPPKPGYQLGAVVGATSFQVLNDGQSSVTRNMVSNQTAILVYGPRIFAGQPMTNIELPQGQMKVFYVDLPAGVQTLTASASGGSGDVSLWIGSAAQIVCTSHAAANNDTCVQTAPVAGRWWIYLFGQQNSVIGTLSLTADPAPSSTIDSLSVPNIVLGEAGTFTVKGFGFTQTSIVRWAGQPLPTEFISATELRATYSVTEASGEPRSVAIDVIAGGPPAAGEALSSNAASLAIVRSASDVNCDNQTTASDAIWLMRFLAELETAADCNRDANLDGSADLADAQWILNDIAGTVAPKPAPTGSAPSSTPSSGEGLSLETVPLAAEDDRHKPQGLLQVELLTPSDMTSAAIISLALPPTSRP